MDFNILCRKYIPDRRQALPTRNTNEQRGKIKMGKNSTEDLAIVANTPRPRHWLEDKPALNYIYEFPNGMEGICRTLMMGEGKYTRGEWKEGSNTRYARISINDSMNRHLMASENGERTDPESGLDHLYHVAVNALMLAEKYGVQPQTLSQAYPWPTDGSESD